MQTLCLPSKKEIVKCNHGISSYFYPLSDNRGIKFFNNKRERDHSKYYQHIAFLSGLAPEDFEDVYSDGYWGYVTESVEMLHSKYEFKEVPKKYLKMIDNLCDEIYNCCDFEVDINYKNFGIMKNRLVLVDFGFFDNDYVYNAR